MTDAELIERIGQVLKHRRAIIAIEGQDGYRARYINMQEGEAARALYAIADAIVERIPLPEWKG